MSAAGRVISLEILRSAAWRGLSANARIVLVAMARQYNGRKNGLLTFNTLASAALGLTSEATDRALAELEMARLIDRRELQP